MGAIGSKLNKLLNNRGLTIVEVLVSVALLGTFVSALNLFTLSAFTSIKMMRVESFVRLFNVNIDQLLNSRRACMNTFLPLSPLANGDVVDPFRNAGNNIVLDLPVNGLNNNNVDVISATVENLQTVGLNIRYNIQITYRYNTFNPAQLMVKNIPMRGTIDGGGVLQTCESARNFVPDNLFVRSDINDIKIGSLTINGNLTFEYAGGSDVLSKLVVVPQVATPAATGTGPSIFIPSDRNLKKDIEPIDASKLDFNQLHAYRYKYKDSKNYSIGFLSQEVQKFSPESVDAPKDSYMAVNYDAVLPYVWEYHKHVYHKNIELNNRLKALEERIDKIK